MVDMDLPPPNPFSIPGNICTAFDKVRIKNRRTLRPYKVYGILKGARPVSSTRSAPLRISVPLPSHEIATAFGNLGSFVFNGNPCRATAPIFRVIRDVLKEYHPHYTFPIKNSVQDNSSSVESALRRLEDIESFVQEQALLLDPEALKVLLQSLLHHGRRRALTRKRLHGADSEWLRGPLMNTEPTEPLTPSSSPAHTSELMLLLETLDSATTEPDTEQMLS